MSEMKAASTSQLRTEIRAQLGGATKKTADQLFEDISRNFAKKHLKTTKREMLICLGELLDEEILIMDGYEYLRK